MKCFRIFFQISKQLGSLKMASFQIALTAEAVTSFPQNQYPEKVNSFIINKYTWVASQEVQHLKSMLDFQNQFLIGITIPIPEECANNKVMFPGNILHHPTN